MWDKLKRVFKAKYIESDDFIKRIRSLVIGEGMLKEGNISLMDFAIKNMPKVGHVLEIGSYGGLSTNLIIHLMRKYQKHNSFFACDAWIYEGFKDNLKDVPDSYIDGSYDILRTEYSKYLKEAFINSTRFLSPQNLPFSFHLYSDSFFESWSENKMELDIFGGNVALGGPISFAYIDGGHSYEVAWKDFNNIAYHPVKNGFVLLDDSVDGQNFGSQNNIKNKESQSI